MSPFPVVDKAREIVWSRLYSIIDRSNIEHTVFELIKNSLDDLPVTQFLLHTVQSDLLKVFPNYARTLDTGASVTVLRYTSYLSTINQVRQVQGNYHRILLQRMQDRCH